MSEALQMLDQATSKDMFNITFFAALAAGLTHYGWLDGRTAKNVGQDRLLASHSALPENARDSKMSATYGPLFGGSSPSADLQSALGNRLRQRMAVNGSPEYALTWKRWDMLSGPPICALRASAHRISGKDCGGWGTPKTVTGKYQNGKAGKILNLEGQADLAGWSTCSSRDWRDTPGMATTGTNPDGTIRKRLDQLPRQAGMVLPSGGLAGMGNYEGYRLNPKFSLWLQGYPAEWACCGARAMQSCRK